MEVRSVLLLAKITHNGLWQWNLWWTTFVLHPPSKYLEQYQEAVSYMFLVIRRDKLHFLSKISFPPDLNTPQKHLPRCPPGEDSKERQVNCAHTCPLVDLLRWSLQLRGSIPGGLWATALAWIPCGIVARWRPPSTIHLFNVASVVMSCCMAVLSHSVCRHTHRVSHLLHVKICVTSVRCPQRVLSHTTASLLTF